MNSRSYLASRFAKGDRMTMKTLFSLLVLFILFSSLAYAGNPNPPHDECKSNKDCPLGYSCILSSNPDINGRVCDNACTQDSDCTHGGTCGLNTNTCIVKGSNNGINCVIPPANNGQNNPNSPGSTATLFNTATQKSGFEVISSWQVISILALMVSIILVAIAYMMGHGFEMPELKAWASSEAVQIVATAVIIIVLIGTMAFVDSLSSVIVQGSAVNVPCNPGEPCLAKIGTAYLADYSTTAADAAKSVLRNNIDAAAQANRRLGLYCLTIYCAQLGVSTTIAGQYILDQDLYSLLFEYYTNIISSIESQKFFLANIGANGGPLLLALGIAARSFFFTRKLGGLLIAVAVGIMFFLPAMYLFNWATLDSVLSGDKGIDQANPALCPAECSAPPPLAVYYDSQNNPQALTTVTQVYSLFNATDPNIALTDQNTAAGIVNGSIASATSTNPIYPATCGQQILSCSSPVDTNACPVICRDLPYPSNSVCANLTLDSNGKTVQQECALVPDYCKVRRVVNVSAPDFPSQSAQCPASCKIIPPLRSNCDVVNASGNCLASRFDCRVYQRNAGGSVTWAPNPPQNIGNYQQCEEAQACPVDAANANKSCSYVLPQTGSCDDLCTVNNVKCPQYCRVTGGDATKLPADCLAWDTRNACNSCPDTCKANVTAISAPAPGTCELNGVACDPVQRVISAPLSKDSLDPDNACYIGRCGTDSRVQVPSFACQSCVFSQESDTYNPPINTQCAQLCSPPNNAPTKRPGDYMKIGSDGLVGRTDIQGVARLMIPAYFLPLFDFVATLVFIKGLSGILGGDIDIPGISKVF